MKNNLLGTQDYIVFLVYFVIVAGYGLYIYNKKKICLVWFQRLLPGGGFINLVGNWCLINCFKYLC